MNGTKDGCRTLCAPDTIGWKHAARPHHLRTPTLCNCMLFDLAAPIRVGGTSTSGIRPVRARRASSPGSSPSAVNLASRADHDPGAPFRRPAAPVSIPQAGRTDALAPIGLARTHRPGGTHCSRSPGQLSRPMAGNAGHRPSPGSRFPTSPHHTPERGPGELSTRPRPARVGESGVGDGAADGLPSTAPNPRPDADAPGLATKAPAV